MQAKFCHNCGTQLKLGAKFCSDCGTSQAALTEKPPRQVAETFTPFVPKRRRDDPDDDDEETIDHHLDIRQDGLQLEIIKDRPLGETIGAAMSFATPPPNPKDYRPSSPIDEKAVIAEFQKEGSALNPKNRNHRIEVDEKS